MNIVEVSIVCHEALIVEDVTREKEKYGDEAAKVDAEMKMNVVGIRNRSSELPLVYVEEDMEVRWGLPKLSLVHGANNALRKMFFEPHGRLPPGTTVHLSAEIKFRTVGDV